MRIDFYRVTCPNGVNIEGILTKVSNRSGKARTHVVEKVPYRIQRLSHDETEGIWEGDIVRIRMYDVPMKVSLQGSERDVELEDEEGLGESTAFVYHVKTRVLVIQRTRSGVSPSRFTGYCEMAGGIQEPILADAILQKGAALKLSRLRVARRFKVRLAGITNPQLLTGHNPAAKEAVKLLSGDAPFVQIEMYMGREQGTLSVEGVKESAKQFLKWAAGMAAGIQPVDEITVTGTFDDEGTKSLNLLEYRMTEMVDVPADPRSKRIPYADRKPAIKRVFESHKSSLEELYG